MEPVTVVVMSLNNGTIRPETQRRCLSNIIFGTARKHEAINIHRQRVSAILGVEKRQTQMYTADVYDTMLLRVRGLTENGTNRRF